MKLEPSALLAVQSFLGPKCGLTAEGLAQLIGEALWQFRVTTKKFAERERPISRKALAKAVTAANYLAALDGVDRLERLLAPDAGGTLSADIDSVAARIRRLADIVRAGPTVDEAMEAKIGKADHAGRNLIRDLAFVYRMTTGGFPAFSNNRMGKVTSPFIDFVNVVLAASKMRPLSPDQVHQRWLIVGPDIVAEMAEIRASQGYCEQSEKSQNKSIYHPNPEMGHVATTNSEVASDATQRARRRDH